MDKFTILKEINWTPVIIVSVLAVFAVVVIAVALLTAHDIDERKLDSRSSIMTGFMFVAATAAFGTYAIIVDDLFISTMSYGPESSAKFSVLLATGVAIFIIEFLICYLLERRIRNMAINLFRARLRNAEFRRRTMGYAYKCRFLKGIINFANQPGQYTVHAGGDFEKHENKKIFRPKFRNQPTNIKLMPAFENTEENMKYLEAALKQRGYIVTHNMNNL